MIQIRRQVRSKLSLIYEDYPLNFNTYLLNTITINVYFLHRMDSFSFTRNFIINFQSFDPSIRVFVKLSQLFPLLCNIPKGSIFFNNLFTYSFNLKTVFKCQSVHLFDVELILSINNVKMTN